MKNHIPGRRWNRQALWVRSCSENIHSPDRGEEPGNLPGGSDWSSSTPFQDSSPYDGEARNDFWSISGNFIYRHHVEPRVKLYVPREASFPIPLKYIDVTRATSASSDVMLEKYIYDYSKVDGDRYLSDTWRGFTRFTILDEKPPDGICVVRGEIDKKENDIQTRLSVARNLERHVRSVEAKRKAEVGHRKTEA